MNKEGLDRRRFLKGSAVAGSAILLERAVFGDSLGIASNLPQPPTLVRKDIDSMTADEIEALRNGIRVMQGRPDSSPTSWNFQANIHGVPSGGGSNPTWNSCRHGSFFFLSWHRMYLYFFERIVRAAAESPNLTLPYWNYSKSVAARALPLAFRTPATGNPLFITQRGPGVNAGGGLAALDVQIGPALSNTAFAGFGGRINGRGAIESMHNGIHSKLGGWMGAPSRAARDPIFWLHHANIDRLWNRWLSMGGGRANPVSSAQWTSREFSFFNEYGGEERMSACDILNSASQLQYKYDTDGDPVGGVCGGPSIPFAPDETGPQEVIASRQLSVTLGSPRVTVSLNLGTDAMAAIGAIASSDKKFTLKIGGIRYAGQPGVTFETYINLPAGETDPNWEGPHYVGSLALFGTRNHDGAAHTAQAEDEQEFPITESLQQLSAIDLLPQNRLKVTFIARGLNTPSGGRMAPKILSSPRFTRISLLVE